MSDLQVPGGVRSIPCFFIRNCLTQHHCTVFSQSTKKALSKQKTNSRGWDCQWEKVVRQEVQRRRGPCAKEAGMKEKTNREQRNMCTAGSG